MEMENVCIIKDCYGIAITGRYPFKMEDRCLVCDTKEELHRHHHNYEKAKAKDVTFLCKDHHHELHSWDSI